MFRLLSVAAVWLAMAVATEAQQYYWYQYQSPYNPQLAAQQQLTEQLWRSAREAQWQSHQQIMESQRRMAVIGAQHTAAFNQYTRPQPQPVYQPTARERSRIFWDEYERARIRYGR
jgi:hypothetical protein